MYRAILTAVAIAAAPVSVMAEAKTYALDPGHTEVRFVWNHAGVSDQGARWDKVEGTVNFDPENIGATTINVTIDPNSVNSGVGALNKHMKSGDMFDTANFPTITFTSTGAIQTGTQNAEITGDLTVKDITMPLVLDVELLHMGPHPLGQFIEYYQGDWVGVRATGRLLRSKVGVGYGAPLTSDVIRLEISSEMKSQ